MVVHFPLYLPSPSISSAFLANISPWLAALLGDSCSSSTCSPCITLVGARATRETCSWLETTLQTGSSPWLPLGDGLSLLELGEQLGGTFRTVSREEDLLVDPVTGAMEQVHIRPQINDNNTQVTHFHQHYTYYL